MDSKVEQKYQMIVASGSGTSNSVRASQREIEDTFFQTSDVVELVSAKDVRKALQRIKKRDEGRGKSLYDIRKYLIARITQAFRVVPKIAPDDLYGNTAIEIRDFEDRKDKTINEINNVLS